MDAQNTWNQLRSRAQSDAAFRAELEANPDGVILRETGLTMAEFQKLTEELSETDLEQVAGGATKWVCGKCGLRYSNPLEAIIHPLTCSMNPF